MTPIAPLIEAFLDETLARQRAVSRHTRDSYALSFQLLFSLVERKEIGGSAPGDRQGVGGASPLR